MLKKLAVLLLASSFMLMAAKADTIVASSATNTTNNSGSATLNIAPNLQWAPAIPGPNVLDSSHWISYAITGNPVQDNFVVVPNGTDVIFTQTFNLGAPVEGGYLDVLADDTSSVILNGTTIFAANLNGSYPTCSNQPIGCLTSTEAVIDLSQFAGLFTTGVNTLSFQVYQENGSSYGLDYYGDINTPEPGTLAMLGIGLVGLFLMGRREVAGSFAS
jgi:hypothetical protein